MIVGEIPEQMALPPQVIPLFPPVSSALMVSVTSSPLAPDVNWKLLAKVYTPAVNAVVPSTGPLMVVLLVVNYLW